MSGPIRMMRCMMLRRPKWLRRHTDLVEDRARRHLHENLRHIGQRVDAFLAEDAEVRRQVMAQLDYRAEKSANRVSGPAMGTLVLVLASGLTLIVTFFGTVLSGAIATMPTDPKTGEPLQVDAASAIGAVNTIYSLLTIVVTVALVAAGVAWLFAKFADHDHAMAGAWLHIYRHELEQQLPTASIRARQIPRRIVMQHRLEVKASRVDEANDPRTNASTL